MSVKKYFKEVNIMEYIIIIMKYHAMVRLESYRQMCKLLAKHYTPKQIIREMNLLDLDRYNYKSHEYNKIRGYIKKLRSQTFRKDITLKYRF